MWENRPVLLLVLATGAILVLKRTGDPKHPPEPEKAGKPAGRSTPAAEATAIGKEVIEAIRTGDKSKLVAIFPDGLSGELATEIKRTREVTLGDFDELLDEMRDDGVDVEKAEFERVELIGADDYSPLGSAEVFFRADSVRVRLLKIRPNTGNPAELGPAPYSRTFVGTGGAGTVEVGGQLVDIGGGSTEVSPGKSVKVHEQVEPRVLGGIRVKVGDNVIDGTVRRRLRDLRGALVSKD